MVASQIVPSRAEAVRLGRRLVRARYIHHVVDGHDFADAVLFYRFYMDEDKKTHRFWGSGRGAAGPGSPMQMPRRGDLGTQLWLLGHCCIAVAVGLTNTGVAYRPATVALSGTHQGQLCGPSRLCRRADGGQRCGA